jgi:hypothetical protein
VADLGLGCSRDLSRPIGLPVLSRDPLGEAASLFFLLSVESALLVIAWDGHAGHNLRFFQAVFLLYSL